MLGVAALIAVGTFGELVLAEHTADPVQWLPFVLLAIGLGAILGVVFAPNPTTIRVLRGVSVLLVVGSTFGIWEHLEHNYAFEAEIRPEVGPTAWIWEAVFGASPLLAPGMVGVIGLLAALATLGAPARTTPAR